MNARPGLETRMQLSVGLVARTDDVVGPHELISDLEVLVLCLHCVTQELIAVN